MVNTSIFCFWGRDPLCCPGRRAAAWSQLTVALTQAAGTTGTHHHTWLTFICFVEMGTPSVAQFGLKILGSSNPPASAPKVLGLQVWACNWSKVFSIRVWVIGTWFEVRRRKAAGGIVDKSHVKLLHSGIHTGYTLEPPAGGLGNTHALESQSRTWGWSKTWGASIFSK